MFHHRIIWAKYFYEELNKEGSWTTLHYAGLTYEAIRPTEQTYLFDCLLFGR